MRKQKGETNKYGGKKENTSLVGAAEGSDWEKKKETVFVDAMTEHFPDLVKDINL